MRELLLAVLCLGCATTPPVDPTPHACSIDVEFLSQPFVGAAEDREPMAAHRNAQAKACDALHETYADVDCENPHEATFSMNTRFSMHNGLVENRTQVTLRRVLGLMHAEARGPGAVLDVCRQAVADACAKIPAETVCHRVALGCEPSGDGMTCQPYERRANRPRSAPLFSD